MAGTWGWLRAPRNGALERDVRALVFQRRAQRRKPGRRLRRAPTDRRRQREPQRVRGTWEGRETDAPKKGGERLTAGRKRKHQGPRPTNRDPVGE
jgi:hypothetical protein